MLFKRAILTIVLLGSIFAKAQSPLFDQVLESLPSKRISHFIEDKNGVLWIANGEHLTVLRGFDSQSYRVPGGAGQLVYVFEKEGGEIWAVDDDINLYQFDGSALLSFHRNGLLSSTFDNFEIDQVMFDGNNLLWLAARNEGVFRINATTGTIIKWTQKGTPFGNVVNEISRGKYIAGNEKGKTSQKLAVYSDGNKFELELSEQGSATKSGAIKLREGHMMYFRGPEILEFTEKEILARNFVEQNIAHLFEDKEGKLWIALEEGGVLCYPFGIAATQTEIEYLAGEKIEYIAESQDGSVYFGSSGSGLFSFFQESTPTYSKPGVFSEVDSAEGETGEAIELEYNPIFSQSERVIPISRDTFPPRIFITSLKINEEDTIILSHYDLNYDENFIEIGYAGFSADPELLRYRYRMQGVNDDWVYTNRNVAQYTTLPPGNYRFEVAAVNREGVWSKDRAEISFVIKPAIWDRLWFRVVLLIILIALVVTVIALWVRNMRQKETARIELQKRISKIELQALRAQMNPHFLFNTLSSIQHFITENKSKEAITYLAKFARLMRLILDNSKQPSVLLEKELEALDIYLQLESLRFKNKFEYKIEVDQDLDPKYDTIPPLLIQPYVENAIMHGILHKEGKGHILVKLEMVDEMMKCIVEDDGVGREVAQELKKQRSHQSHGMSITAERLDIINSTLRSDMSVEVIDLTGPNGEAGGTRVEVFVPMDD